MIKRVIAKRHFNNKQFVFVGMLQFTSNEREKIRRY